MRDAQALLHLGRQWSDTDYLRAKSDRGEKTRSLNTWQRGGRFGGRLLRTNGRERQELVRLSHGFRWLRVRRASAAPSQCSRRPELDAGPRRVPLRVRQSSLELGHGEARLARPGDLIVAVSAV
jgi:hypothetical protein